MILGLFFGLEDLFDDARAAAEGLAASADDGMFDEPDEKITGVVPKDLRKGKHRLVVRARDSFGNIASAAVFF